MAANTSRMVNFGVRRSISFLMIASNFSVNERQSYKGKEDV